MFNRNLEVKLVKPSKSTKTESAIDAPKTDLLADIAMESIREVTRGAAVLTATYVLADTLRKVTVHVIATKFN